jgi:Nickel/cobalt transporter regulator
MQESARFRGTLGAVSNLHPWLKFAYNYLAKNRDILMKYLSQMKYLVAAVFTLGLLVSPPAMAARHHHHRSHAYWDHRTHWGHGMRLHRSWRDYSWVDWRRHHFRDPGRYHWIFVDGQFLLVDDRGLVIEIGM